VDQPRLDDIAHHLDDPGNAAFLCELHIPGTSSHDWQSIVDLIRHRHDWASEYLEDGEVTAMPDRVEDILGRNQIVATTLRTTTATLHINTNFFTPEDIEFDVPARELSTQARLDELFAFVNEIAHATGRSVFVTPEGAEDSPFLTYNPTDSSWAIH
jgi:hypothetical protein